MSLCVRDKGQARDEETQMQVYYVNTCFDCLKCLLSLRLKCLLSQSCVCVCESLSGLFQLFATLWTVAHQAPLSMRFSRQEQWGGPVDCGPPGSSVHAILQARILQWVVMASSRGSFPHRDGSSVSWVSCIAGRFFTTSTTWEAKVKHQFSSVQISCSVMSDSL